MLRIVYEISLVQAKSIVIDNRPNYIEAIEEAIETISEDFDSLNNENI